MTKVFLVPEAKPRDTKHTAVIIYVMYHDYSGYMFN